MYLVWSDPCAVPRGALWFGMHQIGIEPDEIRWDECGREVWIALGLGYMMTRWSICVFVSPHNWLRSLLQRGLVQTKSHRQKQANEKYKMERIEEVGVGA